LLLSQEEEFATIAELDRSYMGCIERGERNVATLNLVKIAKALDLYVGELFLDIDKTVCRSKK